MPVAKKVATPKKKVVDRGEVVKVTKSKGEFISHYKDGSTGIMTKEEYFK